MDIVFGYCIVLYFPLAMDIVFGIGMCFTPTYAEGFVSDVAVIGKVGFLG